MQGPTCAVQQTCNGAGTSVVFGVQGLGIAPCHLQVLNSGGFAIVDSQGVAWSFNNVLNTPGANSGTLAVGQTLAQVTLSHHQPSAPMVNTSDGAAQTCNRCRWGA